MSPSEGVPEKLNDGAVIKAIVNIVVGVTVNFFIIVYFFFFCRIIKLIYQGWFY